MVSVAVIGCGEGGGKVTSDDDSNPKNTKKNNELNLHSNFSEKSQGSSKNIEKNILAEAQKNYQSSYNEYVRCLRESGPQTLETLQALTVYQKNYQIYQMLLKAESNK